MSREYVGIDLHRRRSVIVRMNEAGETLSTVSIDNDPVALSLEVAKAGDDADADADDVAAVIERALVSRHPKARYHCGLAQRFAATLSRVAPTT